MPSSLVRFLAGQAFGRYRLLEEVARGGMGVVLKAEDPLRPGHVAIKTLPPELAHDPELVRRLEEEAGAQAKVQHPNIVGLIERGTDPQPHLVMEFVEGTTLRERITAEGPLKTNDGLRVAQQVVSALRAIHATATVHCDLNPANIMLRHDERATVQLLDFGIARTVGDPFAVREGVVLGTLGYMSPEHQASLSTKVTCASDVYSLAPIVFEIFSGQPLFAGETANAIARERPTVPKRVSELSAMPEELRRLLTAMLLVPPTDRPSMDSIAQTIDQLLDRLPPNSGGTPPPRAQPPPDVLTLPITRTFARYHRHAAA